MTPHAGFGGTWTPPNKRMHATADTRDVIFGQLVGRRVMRSVRRRYDVKAAGSEGRGGQRRITPRAGLRGGWTPPNKRMHATRDTTDFIFLRRLGRARDARR